MRKRGKKLLAIMLAASMTLGQGSTWTLAQEEVAETIEGAALNAQAEEAGAEEIGDEGGQDTPSGDSEDIPTPGEEETGDSESDNSSENNQGTGDNSGENPSEDNNQGTGDDSGFSDETGGGDTSDNNGNQDGDPENPDSITDGEQKDETPENGKTDFHYEDAKIIIDAKATAEAGFKEDTVLKADYLDPEGTDEQKAAYQNAVEIIRQQLGETLTNNNEEATLDYVLYDVYFESQTGERLEPADGTVKVTMSFKEPVKLETKDPETNEQYELLNKEVVHIQQDENDTKTAELVENSNIQIENDQITSATFTQDSFSVMGLVWAKAAVQNADNDAEIRAVQLLADDEGNVFGTGIQSGSSDLDDKCWDGDENGENKGYDNSKSNNIIRSFDSIYYKVSTTINLGENKNHTLVLKVALPNDDEINLDTSRLGTDDVTFKQSDDNKQKIYTIRYSLATDNDYAAGEVQKALVVNVGNKKQGDRISPIIEAYLDEDEGKAKTVGNMQEVIVTSAPMYNLVLAKKDNESIELDSFDFNGETNKPSKAKYYPENVNGDDKVVVGYLATFGVALEIRKPGASKGVKGVELPDPNEGITFKIDLSNAAFGKNNLIDNGFIPKLYYSGPNRKGGDAVWHIPFTDKTDGDADNSCHDSGTFELSQSGTVISVTVKDFGIDMTDFPKKNLANDSYWENLNAIKEGVFSAFQFKVVYPNMNDQNETLLQKWGTGNVNAKVSIYDMNAKSEAGTTTTVETIPPEPENGSDNFQTVSWKLEQGSGRNMQVYYSGRSDWTQEYTPGKKWSDGDIAAVGADNIAFTVSYEQNNVGKVSVLENVPVAIDQLVMINPSAIEDVEFHNATRDKGYACTMLYAVRKNGVRLDNESMKIAKFEDFNYVAQKPEDGKYDGVLFQYRGINLGKSKLDLIAQCYARVKSDAAIADKVYMISAITNVWTATDLATKITAGTGKNLAYLSQNRSEISAWMKNQNSTDIVKDVKVVLNQGTENEKVVVPALLDDRSNTTVPTYTQGVYNVDTAHKFSVHAADGLYIVPYTTTVTKTVAQLKESKDEEKSTPMDRYNVSKGQRYADYVIDSAIKYWGSVTPPENETTTVYLEDTLPKGLSYEANSAYWGGDYQSRFPLAGVVKGGKQIEPTIEDGDKGTTILKWKIENVPLHNGALPSLHYTCKIGNELEPAKDVTDNDTLNNTVTIQTDEDKRPAHTKLSNIATAAISVTREMEFYIVKRGGDRLELQDDSYYELIVSNTSSNAKKNLWMFDTLPYDGKNNSVKKGKYSIKSLSLNAMAIKDVTDIELWYSFDEKYAGKTADDIDPSEVTQANGWFKAAQELSSDGSTVTFKELENTWPTAIAYHDASLENNAVACFRLEYTAKAGAENDNFINTWSTMSNNTEVSSSVKTKVYKRTLEGTVWLDKNKDGKLGSDGEIDDRREGVKVTLLVKTTDENGNEKWVPYTAYDETVDGKTYKCPSTVTTDADGHYKFTGLPEGEYRVKFESGDTGKEASIADYDVTTADQGNDEESSKVKTEEKENGKLIYGMIKDITMPSLDKLVEMDKRGELENQTYNLPNQNMGLVDSKTVCIAGEKTWNDSDNAAGDRPESIKVTLYAGKEEVLTKTVSESDGWKWEFVGYPKYNDKGKEITYFVKEEKVPDYTTEVEGYDITNTYTPETIDITGEKIWDDKDNQDGKRPGSITIRLLGNGTVVDTKEVSASDNWRWSFKNLRKYSRGTETNYTVTENGISDYVTDIKKTETENGYKYEITNTYTPGKISLSVTKAWSDSDDQDGKRPDKVEIWLYANGEKTDKNVSLSSDNSWNYTFTNLDEYKAGKKIEYTVKEDEVDGYTAEVTGDAATGYIVTNTYTPETVKIPVTKVWDDSNNADRIRPDKVVINLLADGISTGKTLELSGSNNWTGEFKDLAKYKEKGTQIKYTITETEVNGYKCKITGDMENGYTVTNTHTPTPYIPSNPDPKPSVTPSVTPSITPMPSTTPTPSGTPTPSATPTPSETPKPSEAPKPSVTPPAEETPTPAPAAGSITVTKNLKVNGTPVGAENQKFYVALFEDEDCTQRASEVKTLTFQYASTATVTFDNLKSGKTYYVSETDENGEAILAGILDSGDIYTADFTNGNIVSVDGKNGSTVNFDNEFEDIPDGFYYVGNLKVTKTLLGSDGKAKNSDKTFYAGVFADADHTKLSDQVAKNIIPLSLNGASSVSDEVEVYMENADSVVKLYVTEVDKNGTPVEKDNSFAYSVTVKDGNATISKDALDARVVITNQEKNNPAPQGGGDTPSTQGGGSNPQSYSSGSSSVTPVKTGDSTPVMAMLLLLAASALVISTVMAKKKKSK